ncbi:MAG: HPr family phosphocarrier protein [Anaerocolumna sp.]
METKQIKLNTPEEVIDFVKAAEQCDFDIDLYYNRIIVDAKSFLGIMSLDISKILNISYYGHNSKLESIIQKYAVRKETAGAL